MNTCKISLLFSITDRQVDQLLELYRNEFWYRERRRSDVDKMLSHSDIVIAAVDGEENLVGFVRVLTDYVYKATIYDLIVAENRRGEQLGRRLMDAVISHPELKSVEHFDLHCLPEMQGFYQKWEFTSEPGDLMCMRRFTRGQGE